MPRANDFSMSDHPIFTLNSAPHPLFRPIPPHKVTGSWSGLVRDRLLALEARYKELKWYFCYINGETESALPKLHSPGFVKKEQISSGRQYSIIYYIPLGPPAIL